MVALAAAGLTLGVSAYQSYAHMRNLELMQQSQLRGEVLRTCREIIDVYYLLRLRVGQINTSLTARTSGVRLEETPAGMEAASLLAKFGALATLIANFGDPSVRARYTNLTAELQGIIKDASTLATADFDKRYEPADKLFAVTNDDCARMAHFAART